LDVKCKLCKETEGLYYYYPVGNWMQGYKLCKVHGDMLKNDSEKFFDLLDAMIFPSKKKGKVS